MNKIDIIRIEDKYVNVAVRSEDSTEPALYTLDLSQVLNQENDNTWLFGFNQKATKRDRGGLHINLYHRDTVDYIELTENNIKYIESLYNLGLRGDVVTKGPVSHIYPVVYTNARKFLPTDSDRAYLYFEYFDLFNKHKYNIDTTKFTFNDPRTIVDTYIDDDGNFRVVYKNEKGVHEILLTNFENICRAVIYSQVKEVKRPITYTKGTNHKIRDTYRYSHVHYDTNSVIEIPTVIWDDVLRKVTGLGFNYTSTTGQLVEINDTTTLDEIRKREYQINYTQDEVIISVYDGRKITVSVSIHELRSKYSKTTKPIKVTMCNNGVIHDAGMQVEFETGDWARVTPEQFNLIQNKGSQEFVSVQSERAYTRVIDGELYYFKDNNCNRVEFASGDTLLDNWNVYSTYLDNLRDTVIKYYEKVTVYPMNSQKVTLKTGYNEVITVPKDEFQSKVVANKRKDSYVVVGEYKLSLERV